MASNDESTNVMWDEATCDGARAALQDEARCDDARVSVLDGCVEGKPIEDNLSDHDSEYDPDTDFMITGVFTEDEEGNNELHIYPKELAYTDQSSAEQFHDIVTSFDESQIQKAINRKNKYGKTPLLEFLDEDTPGVVWSKSDMRLYLLNTLLELGSDVNAYDNLNMSVVYKIVEKSLDLEGSTEYEMLKVLLQHGADINKADIFGRNPIFLSSDKTLSIFLIENGADINVTDKWGRNLLHNAIASSNKELVEFYLDLLGPDVVNTVDVFGSTPLHYASISSREDVCSSLVEKGADINAKDNKGQTPLHIAARCGKNDRLDYLISQGGDQHVRDDQCDTPASLRYSPVQLVIRRANHVDEILQREEHSDYVNTIDNDGIKRLLHSPGLGVVREEKESQDIKVAIITLIEAICKSLGHLDNQFTCTMFPTGSSEEGTKVGQPNEFDFVLCLDKFTELANILESEDEKGFAIFQAVKAIPCGFNDFFDKAKRCIASEVRAVFGNLLRRVICDETIWSNPHLYYNGHIRHASNPYRPVFTLNCGWVSTTYKDQFISVDIVPAVRQKGWWSPSTDFTKIGMMSKQIQNEGCLLLFQSFGPLMRVSCAPAEICLVKSLPHHVRESYRLCKLLFHESKCPKIGGLALDDCITSYMLKNSLFHVLQECSEDGLTKEDKSSELIPLIRQIAIKIIRFFGECAKAENLPFYFFRQMDDMFTFEQKEFEDMQSVKKIITDKCRARLAYSKLVLFVLGDKL